MDFYDDKKRIQQQKDVFKKDFKKMHRKNQILLSQWLKNMGRNNGDGNGEVKLCWICKNDLPFREPAQNRRFYFQKGVWARCKEIELGEDNRPEWSPNNDV